MKFKATSTSIENIHQFMNVLNTLNKILKKCVIRLTSNKMFFILPNQITNGGVSMWCELKQENFFDLYQMEGMTKKQNEIYLEIVAENICRALKSANNAKCLKVKLTKKQVPCLTFEIELPSLMSSSRAVTHDIPVHVIPRQSWKDYQEPEMPNFHVCLCMPPLSKLKNITERLKNLSHYLKICGNQKGYMMLQVETELVTARTSFQGLEVPEFDEDSQAPSKSWNPEEFACARIDIKKFSQFLCGQQINPYKVICNIIHNQAVHFFIVHDNLSLQYFIPVINA